MTLRRVTDIRTNIVKDETGDLVTSSYIILGMWRKHRFQLFNVLMVKYVRPTVIHTTEPLVREVEMAMERLKRNRPPGIDKIPAELIKAECITFRSESINILIIIGIRRNCLQCGKSRSLYIFIRKMIKHI